MVNNDVVIDKIKKNVRIQVVLKGLYQPTWCQIIFRLSAHSGQVFRLIGRAHGSLRVSVHECARVWMEGGSMLVHSPVHRHPELYLLVIRKKARELKINSPY